jgi:hypothetical protein
MPTTVTLSFARPPGFEAMPAADSAATLTQNVRTLEAEAREQRKRTGRSVMGPTAILAQDSRARPRNPEPRRQRNRRVAAKQKWGRIEALLRNKDFVQAYRSRFAAFKQGIKDLLFPAGTYWLRRFASVPCTPVESAAPAR